MGKRREINAALKGADKTPVPQRWREEGGRCKTVGRPFPFLYKEGRGEKRQHRELGRRKLRLGIFEFEGFLSLILILHFFDSWVLTTLNFDEVAAGGKKKIKTKV